jgi:hypothetical protein
MKLYYRITSARCGTNKQGLIFNRKISKDKHTFSSVTDTSLIAGKAQKDLLLAQIKVNLKEGEDQDVLLILYKTVNPETYTEF